MELTGQRGERSRAGSGWTAEMITPSTCGISWTQTAPISVLWTVLISTAEDLVNTETYRFVLGGLCGLTGAGGACAGRPVHSLPNTTTRRVCTVLKAHTDDAIVDRKRLAAVIYVWNNF